STRCDNARIVRVNNKGIPEDAPKDEQKIGENDRRIWSEHGGGPTIPNDHQRPIRTDRVPYESRPLAPDDMKLRAQPRTERLVSYLIFPSDPDGFRHEQASHSMWMLS